jgi:hypothetical protein
MVTVELPPGHRSVRYRLIARRRCKPCAIFAIFAAPHVYRSNTTNLKRTC